MLKTSHAGKITSREDVVKRFLIIVLLFSVLAFSAFAISSQKVLPIGNDIIETIRDIYLVLGHAMPSSAGPWSEAELRQMLEAIPRSSVPLPLLDSYDRAVSELDKDMNNRKESIRFALSADATVELYYHTNTDGLVRKDINDVEEKLFVGRENWSYDLVHNAPLLNLGFEFDVEDSFYFYAAAPLMAGFHTGIGYEGEIGNSNFSSNIPGLQGGESGFSMDPNWPYRAFVAFGSAAWNVQIGRDRLSWGQGMTGNLGVSDNLPYYDMFRFTAFSDNFKYTFLVSPFPHKVNFYSGGYVGSATTEKNKIEGISLYISHRFEGRFFRDRLSFAITEAIMYSSEDGVLDFRSLNPSLLYHNLYTTSNTNSTMVAEIDYTPVAGLNLYGQLLLDDFAIPGGENGSGPSTYGYPNALGYLAGIRSTNIAGRGLLTVNLEGAYVNPYTYLRYHADYEHPETEEYGLDYVVALRTYVSGSRGNDILTYDEYFLGYPYGGDCIVADLNVGWKKPGVFGISANSFFMAHGTHDKWTRWSQIGNSGEADWNTYSVTPTSGHQTGNYKYDADELNNRTAVSFTLDLGVNCHWMLNEHMKAYCQLDYIKIWNRYNRKGYDNQDFQTVIGLTYSI